MSMQSQHVAMMCNRMQGCQSGFQRVVLRQRVLLALNFLADLFPSTCVVMPHVCVEEGPC